MNTFSIQLFGKIYGHSNSFEDAKRFARNLGSHAIVFFGPIVVYPV